MSADDKQDPRRGPKRRRSPLYQANNKGGYGNPPVKGQFPKGNRGGPGRPRGVTNLETAMRKVLAKRLTVTKDGRAVRMTPWEVYAERVLEAILSKTTSPAMLEFGRDLLTRFGVSDPRPKADYSVFSDTELQLFGGLLCRALGEPPEAADMFATPVEGIYRVDRRGDGHVIVKRADGIEPKLLTSTSD